jgi:hypothetical protein
LLRVGKPNPNPQVSKGVPYGAIDTKRSEVQLLVYPHVHG